MLAFLAWAVIVLKAIELLLMPALFGYERKRKEWGYGDWIGAFISGLVVVPLALRVLGYI